MADEDTEGRDTGPFGIDPLHFSFCLFGLLVLFVLYLSLPRGLRVQYFKAYPKRYAWSARSRARRNGRSILQVCSFQVSLLSRKMMREFVKGPLSHHGQYLIRDSSRIFVFQCPFLPKNSLFNIFSPHPMTRQKRSHRWQDQWRLLQ